MHGIGDHVWCCDLQAAAIAIALEATQLAAARALYDSYAQQAAHFSLERQQLLTSMQAADASPAPPELSTPLEAAAKSEQMARVSRSYAMQQEAYLHLTRTFVLHVLTPIQAGLLCAASYPYLVEFPSVMAHILNAAGSPSLGDPVA